jgi:hypothetical protein
VQPSAVGSLPNDVFSELLELPTVWVPHSYRGCSQHAPNEHLPTALAREALGLMTGIYWDLGKPGTPARRQNRVGAITKQAARRAPRATWGLGPAFRRTRRFRHEQSHGGPPMTLGNVRAPTACGRFR